MADVFNLQGFTQIQAIQPSRHKLTDDVNIEEMLHMRESGMSNKEIANALDVSYATIYRYIGGTRTRNRKEKNPETNALRRPNQIEKFQRRMEKTASMEHTKAQHTGENPLVPTSVIEEYIIGRSTVQFRNGRITISAPALGLGPEDADALGRALVQLAEKARKMIYLPKK